MGSCASVDNKFYLTTVLSLNNFEMKYPIGKGAFGHVWKVIHKNSGVAYAMKEMQKNIIVSKQSVSLIMNERFLLGINKHRFLVNLHYAFQDLECLYLVFDLMSGGDFRFYLLKNRDINEDAIRFLSACIIIGLEYLHSKNIIHGDIKPENLVFDSNGYLHITDFGIARLSKGDNTLIASGTPGYIAPEVFLKQKKDTTADFFALGVIMFECIFHTRPYLGKTLKQYRDVIINKQVIIKMNKESKWSPEFIDLVNRLIERNPENRIGYHGTQEIKNHCFFKDLNWDALYKKEYKSPFELGEENNFDYEYVMKKNNNVLEKITKHDSKKLFAGYYYDASICEIQKN